LHAALNALCVETPTTAQASAAIRPLRGCRPMQARITASIQKDVRRRSLFLPQRSQLTIPKRQASYYRYQLSRCQAVPPRRHAKNAQNFLLGRILIECAAHDEWLFRYKPLHSGVGRA
jgi:hypothetical protein